jgi:proline iminopeptidase
VTVRGKRRVLVRHPIIPLAVLAALPVIVAGCTGGAFTPGNARAAAARGEISLEPAGVLPSAWQVEPGMTLYRFARGTGTPVLVLHGGPGMASDSPWPGLAPLESRYAFQYFHQRGSGRSTRPIDRFTSRNYPQNVRTLTAALGVVEQLADIERIRKALAVDRLILAGHSFGGFMAALYAAEFPDHVAKLVLVAPAAMVRFPPQDGGLYESVRRLLPAEDRESYQRWLGRFFDFGSIFSRSEAELVRTNLQFVPFWERAAAALAPTRGADDPTDPALVGGWVQQGTFFSLGRRYDLRPALSRVSAPVLVVVGNRDPAAGESAADYRAFPSSRAVTMDGCGHFPQRDTVEFPGLVGSFLGE